MLEDVNDAYTLAYVAASEHFSGISDEELSLEGYYDNPVFSRGELELVAGWQPHRYVQEMKRASRWPDVIEERKKALAEQGRSGADNTEGRDPEQKSPQEG